ncbi:hypothetical protein AB0B66_32355 [Catellatospora sp. NPDC049111]|uniref:hypothetical protein n=1 Tax=Catellatospora sp. NPDC049111 TaxID=3155271 RepID=UPI0034002EF1
MEEWEWVLFAQSNVVTWEQASGMLTAAKVRHRVRTGRWRRVCRGVLVVGDGPLSVDQQRWRPHPALHLPPGAQQTWRGRRRAPRGPDRSRLGTRFQI